MSTEWLDTVDVDRDANGAVLFGSRYRYMLDLSRPAGQQWTFAAITLHPDKYPDDPRANSAAVGGLWHHNLPTGTVMVFDKRDRRYVGHMQPPGTRSGAVPMDALQDMVHSLNVYRRSDGEYLVFIEDDGYTKNVLYRWRP